MSEITIEGAPEAQVTEVLPLAIEKHQPALDPKIKGKPKTKGQTKDQNAIFFNVSTFTISLVDIGTWKRFSFNPYTYTSKGTAFNLPFKRNLWTSGQKGNKNYMTTLSFTIMITCPPQVSGYIEIQDSTKPTNRYVFDLTARMEFTVIPSVIAGDSLSGVPRRPRDVLQPSMLTSNSMVAFRWRISALNRTGDIQEVMAKVMVNAGNSQFIKPIKPKNRGPSVTQVLLNELTEEVIALKLHGNNEDFDPVPVDFLMDEMGDEGEFGELIEVDEEHDEDIHQDTYKIPVFDQEVDIGVPIVIPLDLSVIEDVTNEGEESTISQKFERFMNAHPTRKGDYGPVVGRYIINIRLPTTIAGQIEHICLPGEDLPEVAVLAFGLSNILNFAGSALSSIGGPVIGGFLNTAMNAVGGLLGMGNTPEEQPPAQAQPYQITGDIPISRYPALIKAQAQNYLDDPVFGSLICRLTNFIDGMGAKALMKVPMQVFAEMDGVRFDRMVTNRTITPLTTIQNVVQFGYNDTLEVVKRIGECRDVFVINSRANIYLIKILFLLQRDILAKKTDSNIILKGFTLKEIEEVEYNLEFARHINTTKRIKPLLMLP